jgi:hypothetical protein
MEYPARLKPQQPATLAIVGSGGCGAQAAAPTTPAEQDADHVQRPEDVLRVGQRRPLSAHTQATLLQRKAEVESIHAYIATHHDDTFGGARAAPLPPRPLTPMIQPVSTFVKNAAALAAVRASRHKPLIAEGVDTAGDTAHIRAGGAVFSLTPGLTTSRPPEGSDSAGRTNSPMRDRGRLPNRSPHRRPASAGPIAGMVDDIAKRLHGSSSVVATRIEAARNRPTPEPRRTASNVAPRARVVRGGIAGGGKRTVSVVHGGGTVSFEAERPTLDAALLSGGIVHLPAE